MNVASRYASYRWPVFWVCAVSLICSACEEPGSVGSSIIDIDSDVVIDTLAIGEIETDSVGTFSGMLPNFSAGQFDDPLFGNVTATGLIRPGLPSSSSSDSIRADAEMRLKLVINKDGVYGDSLATAEYDLVEMEQIWRGNAWKLSDQVQLSDNGPVASFEISRQDSIEVPLPSAWVDKYREYYESDASNRDSLYTYQFHGLAVIPKNTAKIVPFISADCEFIITNPEADTFSVGLSQTAYSLQRSGADPAPEGSYKVFSTLEQVLSFDMNLEQENLGTVNIARVDLVFYQNNEVLNESIRQVSGSAKRPANTTAQLHYIEAGHVSSALFPGSPIVTGEYDEEDGGFHFNITAFTNGVLLDRVEEGKRFYIRLQTNNGVIRSSLLYNRDAPPAKQPKLIITSIKSEGGSN